MKKLLVLGAISGLLLYTACRDKKRYHDEADLSITQEALVGGTAEVLDFQADLNAIFKDPESSPLPDSYRKNFVGLDFFEPDSSYRVMARLVRTPNALPFIMPTTTERTTEEKVFGIVHFKLAGTAYKLEVYQNQERMTMEGYENYLFLPFTDLTNGEETYSGGRYLDLSIPEGDSLIIDFNKAYNPYCAYNKKYSCPIVPGVNHLATRVRAGVKAFDNGTKNPDH